MAFHLKIGTDYTERTDEEGQPLNLAYISLIETNGKGDRHCIFSLDIHYYPWNNFDEEELLSNEGLDLDWYSVELNKFDPFIPIGFFNEQENQSSVQTEEKKITNESETKPTRKQGELLVLFPNGIEISERTAKDTWIKTLATIGFEQIEQLDGDEMWRRNRNSGKFWKIVSKIEPDLIFSDNSAGYTKIGEWFIIHNYSPDKFAKKLEYISNKLNLGLEIIS